MRRQWILTGWGLAFSVALMAQSGSSVRPATTPASGVQRVQPASAPTRSAEMADVSVTTGTHGLGLKPPPLDYIVQQVAHQNEIASQVLRLEEDAIKAFDAAESAAGRPKLPETILRGQLPAASASAFDWSKLGKVTPVKDQKQCGSCWAFASTAALESSILIRYNRQADLSEQYILDNAIYGNCSHGGWTPEAFTEMMLLGTAKESDQPYREKKVGGRAVFDNPYRALIWGFVGDGINPSVGELKSALLRHGPFAVSIRANKNFEDFFLNNHDPRAVFVDHDKRMVDHVVLLVGWDDSLRAWKIKNSWGPNQGANGFGWIGYGVNSIGFGATWVEALNTNIPIPKELTEWLNKAKKLAAEGEQEERRIAANAERALSEAQAAAQHAQAQAQQLAKQANEKAQFAAELSNKAAASQKQALSATTAADKRAKEQIAKAAAQSAVQAQAEAVKARSEAEHTAKEAQNKSEEAIRAISSYIPAPPDPRKHLPKFRL